MKIVWTPKAEQDRADIYNYIAANNPRAAGRMNVLFGNAVSRLAVFPHMGKTGQIPGTRELFPHKHYRLVYEVDTDTDTIWILTLMHGACDWPPRS